MGRKSRVEAVETRKRLLESALQTMSGNSFSKISMSEIAERVGLSKGALYWHFRSRDDLLLNLLDNLDVLMSWGNADSRFEERRMNSIGDIRNYYRNRLNMLIRGEHFRKLHLLMMRRLEWPESAQKKLRALEHKTGKRELAKLKRVLLLLRKKEEIRDDIPPAELAGILVAVFHGMFLAQVSEMWPYDFSKHVGFIVDALLGYPSGTERAGMERSCVEVAAGSDME